MTRIVCISDTHMKHRQIKVPDGDILIHAGDFCNAGSLLESDIFLTWFDSLPHKHKILVAGNHDRLFENDSHLAQTLINDTDTVDYLQDSFVEREGLKIWGSPWTARFFDWAFNADEDNRTQMWNLIPDDCDIVVTHSPPYMIGDKAPRVGSEGFEYCGCRSLLKTVTERVKPKLHIFGHIHEGANQYEEDGIIFVNASSLDGQYNYVNPPIVIDL